ncbi:hypothetical protein D3C79_508240 [compost metagenome]
MRRWGRQQGRFQHGGQVEVEVLLGDARQAELEADHLALLGGPEAPGHRTRRLRQDRRMRGAAATANRPAAAVEQQQLDLMLTADAHQVFLGPVLCPGRRRGPRVLGRVGVADHHFLWPAQARTVAGQAQQALHHRPGVVEVGQRLEQRHYPHRAGQASLFEQQLHGQHIRRGAGHGDDIGAQRGCGRRCDFPAGGEHFGGFRLRFEVRRQQRSAVLQLGLEECDALLFIPVGIAAQAQVVGDLGQRVAMPGGVLAHVQAPEEQAERHRTAQAVEQRPFGDHAHAAFMQGLIAQLQRRDQVAVVHQHLGARRLVAGQGVVRPGTRRTQAIAQLLEQRPIRFGTVAHLLTQRAVGLLHGQFRCQRIDVAQEQISRHPARQQQHLAGDSGGYVGVAVTVAAHPRGKADRCGFQRQTQAGDLQQRLVDLAQVIGDGLPQGMLDHREAPFGLVDRRGAGAADLFGVPGFGDQPAQALAHLLALGGNQVAVVLGRQLAGDGVVFLDQGAARDLGRVCGQHQLDIELGQLPGQGIVAVSGLFQARQQLGQHARLERLWLVGIAAADQLILLGHVGQVEELVEGPGHG